MSRSDAGPDDGEQRGVPSSGRGAGVVLGAAVAGLMVVGVVATVEAPLPPWVSTDACPAVGFSSLLEATLSGDTADVAHVRVCDDEGRCEPPAPGDPDAGAVGVPPERRGGTWLLTLFSSPDRVVLQALDADGAVLAETVRDVEWRRVGGSERCGGPMEGETSWRL
ncbi:hypothetical protein [Puerhibacterium sp. TATVAM-FAB25]|uniref:hypothetical protein n=1 Tax=Puerhibacterium sp. TATVAM-FAB25 TaxID=3093699 RepID=UPI00397CCA4F